MSAGDVDRLTQALDAREQPPFERLADLDAPDKAVVLALATPVGRRWLRSLSDLDSSLADQLLGFEEDFRSTRRDSTLERVVNTASLQALHQHSAAIVGSSAASAFWRRLSADPDNLVTTAKRVVIANDPASAESTLYLLTLDPVDAYALGPERRSSIARTGLSADAATTRSLAAEYLFDNDVAVIADVVDKLVFDSDERVRGLAWSAGFRTSPGETYDLAMGTLGDESAALPARRSALMAIGTHFDTRDVIDILTLMVGHPDELLALDAGNLLYRLHRHPTIATAAAQSPHACVREIGEFLLDPYRGSPAAGGSRPGDPTTSDIFAEMIRQTEEQRSGGEPR